MEKVIFAGTTEFGIPTLEKLKTQSELILVITQPDKPTGRNRQLTPSPIKVWAQKHNIRVEQPEKIINLKSLISDLAPDLLLVAAYGQIIPKDILDLPKFGSINIHGSLLPKYRGASPIQATILNGDIVAGITLIKMDEQMDHGPILSRDQIMLDGHETYPELYQKLSSLAADLVVKTLPDWFHARITALKQTHEDASFVKLLTRADGKIDWAKPAAAVERMIRAYNPEPGTWTMLNGKLVKILSGQVIIDHKIDLPGKLYVSAEGLAVKCLENSLLLLKVKPDGKNEMTGKDYLNGLKTLNDKIFI